MSQSNPQPNSVAQDNNNGNGSTRLIRIMLILFGIMTLVAVPVLGYFIGNFMGIHMSASDVEQGYAYGGLLYTIYNTTHNPVYGIEAQQVQAIGILNAQGDTTTLSMIGLVGGLIIDPFVAYIFVREYEKLDNE
jgi:ABC-type Fe3+ transport system permease subunit